MKVWLPYIRGGSGTDVFTQILARGLRENGIQVLLQTLAHNYQYAPWLLRRVLCPRGTDVVLTNSWNGFAFRRPSVRLVVVEHHCIFDPAYKPYRSFAQAVFHEGFIRRFELASFRAADAVVAVSAYTARMVEALFPGVRPSVILNGIDTDFFCPDRAPRPRMPGEPFRLLFVGNLTERKGADLLPAIMSSLGQGFELRYTAGLRTRNTFPNVPNMQPTGRLTREGLRQAYRDADALLFPTRLEGFGYAAAEAMACGVPVVSTNGSAIPEVVEHGVDGLLCEQDDVAGFVRAVQTLAADPDRARKMGQAGRAAAVRRFGLNRMVSDYVGVLAQPVETAGDLQH